MLAVVQPKLPFDLQFQCTSSDAVFAPETTSVDPRLRAETTSLKFATTASDAIIAHRLPHLMPLPHLCRGLLPDLPHLQFQLRQSSEAVLSPETTTSSTITNHSSSAEAVIAAEQTQLIAEIARPQLLSASHQWSKCICNGSDHAAMARGCPRCSNRTLIRGSARRILYERHGGGELSLLVRPLEDGFADDMGGMVLLTSNLKISSCLWVV
ncbi:hypothetical protein BASA62_005471 [Batrachochytrium salamandrivorans]|nr:hypothetical protein BASA62_005471 [Batrachochytrium salamandrivorans]